MHVTSMPVMAVLAATLQPPANCAPGLGQLLAMLAPPAIVRVPKSTVPTAVCVQCTVPVTWMAVNGGAPTVTCTLS